MEFKLLITEANLEGTIVPCKIELELDDLIDNYAIYAWVQKTLWQTITKKPVEPRPEPLPEEEEQKRRPGRPRKGTLL